MKILVTGAAGQLGREFMLELERSNFDVVGIDVDQLDLRQTGIISDAIAGYEAEWVLHCAAYTNVDRAEKESELAFRINRDAARAVAQGVKLSGGKLVYLSTDFVFGGDQSSPYSEQDAPGPVNVYGDSKWQGEQAVCEELQDAVVLRTAWVYGTHGENFVKTILRLAAERNSLSVVDDQIGTPTWTVDIVNAVMALVDRNASGIYHFTNEGVASWYDLAREIIVLGDRIGFPLKLKEVKPIPSEDYPTDARRPPYTVLSKVRLRSLLGYDIPHWRASLSTMMGQLHKS